MESLIIIFIIKLFSIHPVHVSVTNTEINTKEKIFNYSVVVNKEDFEYALVHKYDKEIFLNEISDEEKSYINSYFGESLKFFLDSNLVAFDFSDYDYENENLRFFYKGKFDETYSANKLIIENKVLIDTYFDQTNLLIINIDGLEKGFSFNYKDKKVELSLENKNIIN